MAKINKLHFNGVDYDIGDKEIHDLTEKSCISNNDELVLADSGASWERKKAKYTNLAKQTGCCNVLNAKFLLVGGGGQGGQSEYNRGNGGGGGGGGVIEGCYNFMRGSCMKVVIGCGGTGTGGGAIGGTSIFGEYAVLGGGGGAYSCCGTGGDGANGGGGAGYQSRGVGNPIWYSGFTHGYKGGNSCRCGGGGGGAGCEGCGDCGGVGYSSDISGSTVVYANGGGGGGACYTGCTCNTCGSGGGGGACGAYSPADGKGGVLIISYPNSCDFTIGGCNSCDTCCGNKIYTFTQDSTLCVL